MQAAAISFAQRLSQALVGAELDEMVKVVRGIFAPYDSHIARSATKTMCTLRVSCHLIQSIHDLLQCNISHNRFADRYGELEHKQLGIELATIPLPDKAGEDVEAVVAELASASATAIGHIQAAAERCQKLTGSLSCMKRMTFAGVSAFSMFL